jgi:hypothetical protein
MYGADEKKAFEDMLAEIGDDSDDDNFGYSAKGGAKPTSRAVAESKASQVSAAYTAGAKSSSSSTNASSSTYQRQSSQMSKQEEEIERFGSEMAQSAAQVQSEQISATKRWLTRSCSSGDKNTMKCFVERERSTFGMQTTYRCYLEGPNSGGGGSANSAGSVGGAEGAAATGARFLMSAKKRVVNKTSYYLISLDFDAADDRGSESVLGKVRSLQHRIHLLIDIPYLNFSANALFLPVVQVRGNAIGSRYLLTDHGLAPEKAVAPSMLRKVIHCCTVLSWQVSPV